MATVPAEVQGPSDAELIDAVRKGDVSAYGDLYERHVAAAYNLARQLARSQAERDDLVAEAFEKVLATLRSGRGPDSAFRAYLLTALRHTAYDKTRRDRKLELAEDVSEVSGVNPESVSVPFTDPAVAGLERSLAARAFALLPERWQAVLWHTAIEGQSPAEVAPILGLTPNGVSALAYRAREGLKQAYLQVHLAETTKRDCRAATDRLGAWTRDGLSKREKAQVEAHLDDCAQCRALAAELADVNGALRIFVAPLVLGSGTLGYLAAATAAAKAAVTGGVIVAGAAAGAAGSGAGAAAGAGASAPRQVLGVAASAAALAAALAVGLSAGGAKEIPAAQPQPSPTVAPPPPAPPGPQPPTPAPPATQPPQSPPQQPTPPPPAPPPASPILIASPPGVPVSLVAGGGPADLPITVRNTGGSVSGPVLATLNLPAGVTALATGPGRFAGTPMLRLNAKQSSTVFCPGGTGRVSCGTKSGLAPGESVILLFRVVAAEGSAGGEITGTVSDGSAINVKVTVNVVVKPPPPPPVLADGVGVKASGGWIDTLLPGLLAKPLLHVTVTNTGQSTKPVTVSVDRDGVRLSSSTAMACTTTPASTRCTTKTAIEPGKSVKLTVKMKAWLGLLHSCDDPTVVITVTLGSAKDSTTIRLDCWSLPGLPGLVPNGGDHPLPPPGPQGPPRPPTKPHLDAPLVPPTPAVPPAATPAPPPAPLPKAEPPPSKPPTTTTPPASPPRSGGLLGGLLGWLLPR